MNTTVRSESFHAVGEQIAATLREAHNALESFAEGEASSRELTRCGELLHSVRGALNVAGVYGASLLAEEMEATCRFLLEAGSAKQPLDEGIEALSRAMVQLPSYIERVMDGGHDIPLAVLPLLNDLRAARGKPLLSESTLLLLNSPGGHSGSAQPARPQASGEDVAQLLPKLRPQFQLGLLGWIKGTDSEQNLRRMALVAERLERAAGNDELYRLWWVVGGVLEALLSGGLEASIALKRLLGQADREIKRLQLKGEDDFAAQPPTDLINNLLYYVARASGGGERCESIRSAFNLADMGGGDAQIEALRESLAAPSPRLMKTVADAIREDLSRAKDVLDIYVRTGMNDASELHAQVQLLRKIGDTLGVLGLGNLREAVIRHGSELEQLIAVDDDIDEARLVTLAASLLEVEDALESQLVNLVRPVGETEDEPVDADFQAVSEAVLGECIVNLAHIKEAITEMLERRDDLPSGARGMDGVADQLRGVSAGLMMLGRSQAVAVLRRIGAAITHLEGEAGRRDPGRLNRLADAIVSLEYYIETLQAGRKEPVYMLENAERSLDVLDAEQPLQIPEPREESPATQTLRISPEDLPQALATPEEYEKTRLIETPVMATGDEQPDLELLETFIEEAREEIVSINRHLPAWLDDPQDEEALVTVRRSFHTLKGSGRMVGAQLIGEYAWNIENLLNKLISGTIAPAPEICAYLSDAAAALPQLLEQLETGTEPDADIETLAAHAVAFADGVVPDAYVQRPVVAAGGEDEEAGLVPAEEEPGPAGIDPVLLDILTRETATHIATIREFLAASAAEGGVVTEAMHHACHTLHGSMTMANVTDMAGLTDALNQFVEHLFRRGSGMAAAQREICAAAADAVEVLIANLDGGSGEAPDTTDLETRLQQMAVDVAERESASEAELVDQSAESFAGEDGLTEESIPSIPPDDDERSYEPDPEFDAEIAAIFSEEAGEILEAADDALQTLGQDPGSTSALADLQRHLHTLKGGARMAGIRTMGDFSHELESRLISIDHAATDVDEDTLHLLQASIDELHRMREMVLSGRVPPPDAALLDRLTGTSGDTAMLPSEPEPEEAAEEAEASASAAEASAEAEAEAEAEEAAEVAAELVIEKGDSDADEEPTIEPPRVPEPEKLGALARDLIQGRPPAEPQPLPDSILPAAQSPQEPRKEMARVDSAMLEDLLNNAGEISISHSRLKQQVSSIQFNLEELGQTVQRLQQQLRLLEMETETQILFKHQNDAPPDGEEFDPLELDRYSTIQQLSRGLGETASDVSSLKDLLQNIASDTETILSQQQRITSDLQDNLMRTRMVPFEQHVPRLQRLVRQQAQESGKQVELTVRGSSGELDRQVMEKMVAPFEHLLRNAVIHGIETPEVRRQAGKSPIASITITFRREGSHVLIDIADDGSGVDLKRVREKAIEQGLVRESQELSDEELAQLILRSGLTTADKLTQSAGRGIGMDVVVNEIGKLGGTLAIATEVGKGCTFTVRLPYTLAISQAFIVRVGPESFALPLPTVEGVVRIPRAEYEQRMAEDDPAVEYGGRRYRLRHLGLYLGLGPTKMAADEDRVSIVLVAAGENSTALVTDETTDAREIVIKPIGAQLAGIPGIAGATILGDGRIVVILDAGGLVRMPVPEINMEDLVRDEEDDLPPLALVVDDSITMRRVTQRLLERNGMRVVTAKDGLEALEVLQDHRPRIILLDVEMPRMDGYEFAGRVRGNVATENLPIIMVTSRTGAKHRARAIELGVNDYLGKPYQEYEMLEAIRNLIGADFGASAGAESK